MTTAQQLAAYFQQQVDAGRGDWIVEIDPLSVPCRWSVCQLATLRPPAVARMYNEERKLVFIDAVLER